MVKRLLLIVIESFLLLTDGTVAVLNMIKGYGLGVWSNNTVRRFVLRCIDQVVVQFRRFGVYLQKIEDILHYRLLYATVTASMKERYKELKGKKP
jgi:hypothetical protein